MSGTVEIPTFSYNNDNTKPIRAGGVILYKIMTGVFPFRG